MATLEEVRKVPQYVEEFWRPPARTGLWNWFMQRITGALLIVFIIAHFWVTHFAIPGEQITFTGVQARLQTLFFVVLDSALLAATIYHGLNGVRNVIFDFNPGPAAKTATSWIIFVIGLIVFVYGLNALLPFITGRALFILGG